MRLRPAATLGGVWVLAILQLFVWLFAMMFVALVALCIAALDLLLWFELGAPAAAALHLPVVAALLLRRGVRLIPGAIAPS